MASLRVLTFDHEGRPVQFDTWLNDLQMYILSNSKDSVSLFDLASGAAPAPPATADSATRSQWLTRDAAARLAICNLLASRGGSAPLLTPPRPPRRLLPCRLSTWTFDDYTRYTMVFPLRSKGEVSAVLIPWIPTVRLQLRERFGQDLPVLRLHYDKGGEFSSNLLRDFCRGEGILESFTLSDSGGAEPRGAALSEAPAGALPRLSPQQLREWLVRRAHLWSGAPRAGDAGAARAGGAGVAAGAGDPTEPEAAGAGGSCAGGAGAGVAGAGGSCAGGAGAGVAGAGGAGVGGTGPSGAGAAGAGAVDPGARGAGGNVRLRPYFVPLLQQPASPMPAPSPYTEQSGGLTQRCEPASRPVSPFRTAHRVPRSRPPPVPGTHAMALRPSIVPLRVPLPAPPSHLFLRSLTVNPSCESAAVSALVTELLEFVDACCLDYATALVAESASFSPPSVRGEYALGTDVLEDMQEDFECLAAAVPRFASMLLAPEGDLDAPDIPTPRSYAKAITGPYSSQ
ncbi:unnamed protein product [Closterium sp. NIES-53]